MMLQWAQESLLNFTITLSVNARGDGGGVGPMHQSVNGLSAKIYAVDIVESNMNNASIARSFHRHKSSTHSVYCTAAAAAAATWKTFTSLVINAHKLDYYIDN